MIVIWSNFWKPVGGLVRSVYQSSLWRLFPFVLIIGALFSALIPPFQSPDEQDHIKRAYLLSQGRIAMTNLPGESTGGYIDTGLISYIDQFQHLWKNSNERLTLDDRTRAADIKWTGHEIFGSSPGVNYYFPLVYTPQAIGLGFGKLVGMNVDNSYILARFLAFGFSVFVIFLAFTIYRPNPALVGLLLTPLMVFQLCSASQDGVSSALVVLTGALFMRLMINRDTNQALFYLLAFTILILVTSRVNLFPIIGLLFILAFFTQIKRRYLTAFLVTVLSLGWIMYAVKTTVDYRVTLGGSVVEIMLFYILNPVDFIVVLYETFTTPRLSEFYYQTFFGVLGWLDTHLDEQDISLLTICIFILLVCSIPTKNLKRQAIPRLSLIVMSSCSLLLVFFLLMVTWNPFPTAVIEGVQGRYFWAPAILLSYGITANWDDLGRLRRTISVLGVVVIATITFYNTPRILIDRYYLSNQPSSPRSVIKEQSSFTDVETTIKPVSSNNVEHAGYIDEINYLEQAISLKGWGFFTDEEKIFLSNLPQQIDAHYLTIVRQDVANALGDDRFRYSGFILTIPLNDLETSGQSLAELCLYSEDPVLGIKQIQSNLPEVFGCKPVEQDSP